MSQISRFQFSTGLNLGVYYMSGAITYDPLVYEMDGLLASKIYSAYHTFHKQIHGKELHPTQFMYRHQDKPYHLDYCFASSDFISRMSKVEIGTHEEWSHCSDHKPVVVEFDG